MSFFPPRWVTLFACRSPQVCYGMSVAYMHVYAHPQNLSSVAGDLVLSGDIVINGSRKGAIRPSGPLQDKKTHRLPTTAGEYDDIVAWLNWEFAKHDKNKDGSLDYDEFVRFIRSLNLNLSSKEVRDYHVQIRDRLHPSASTYPQFFTLADFPVFPPCRSRQ